MIRHRERRLLCPNVSRKEGFALRLKGRFSALGRQLPLLLGIVVLASGLASAATAGPFSDVPAGHWAYDALEQLSEAGLVDGYPSGFFSVSRRLTRYEVALSVVRALERLAEQASLAPASGEKMDVSELWLGYNQAHPDRPLSPGLRDVLGNVVREFEPELVMLGYGKWTAVLNRPGVGRPAGRSGCRRERHAGRRSPSRGLGAACRRGCSWWALSFRLRAAGHAPVDRDGRGRGHVAFAGHHGDVDRCRGRRAGDTVFVPAR